jgi:acyl-homoserine-lactone acylase
MARKTTGAEKLDALATATAKLARDFGRWDTPWGEINRYQRISAAIDHPFDDARESVAIPFASARWGSLASFGARAYPQTRKWYGTSGNSFVAAVEFGERVRARAIMAGGQSGDPQSKHFTDQIERYAAGNLRDVPFYKDQLAPRAVKTYHPGQ